MEVNNRQKHKCLQNLNTDKMCIPFIILIILMFSGVIFIIEGSKKQNIQTFEETNEFIIYSSNNSYIDYNLVNCNTVENTSLAKNMYHCNSLKNNKTLSSQITSCFDFGICLQTKDVNCSYSTFYKIHCNCSPPNCGYILLCKDMLKLKCEYSCNNRFLGYCTDDLYTCPDTQSDLVNSCKTTCNNRIDTITNTYNCQKVCINKTPDKICEVEHNNITEFNLQFGYQVDNIIYNSKVIKTTCLSNDNSCIAQLFLSDKIYYYITNPVIYQYSGNTHRSVMKSEGIFF
jgi:hypothetical protein